MLNIYFEPPPAYFMHVGKTGGTALGRWLRVHYGSGYVDLDPPRLGRFTAAELQRFRCYHAWHCGRGLFDLIGRGDLPVITMLREPVERAVSSFHHAYREVTDHPGDFSDGYLSAMRPLLQGTIGDGLNHPRVANRLSNAQIRLLGGRAEYAGFLKRGAHANPPGGLRRPYRVPQQINRNDYPKLAVNAHAWLEEMAVVGLTEHYAESVLLVADLLGLPVPAELPSANVNPQRSAPTMRYREQLAPEVAARLEELNRYDLELYAHATALFEQQWARYQAQPRRTYSIASRLRRRKSDVRGWLRRTWPGLAVQVRRARAGAHKPQPSTDDVSGADGDR